MSDSASDTSNEQVRRERSWLDAEVDGRSVRFWVVVGSLIALVTLGFGAFWTYGLERGPQTAAGGGMAQPQPGQQMGGGSGMAQPQPGQQPGSGGGMAPSQQGEPMGGGQMAADVPRVPPVFGYYDDREVFFIHTEASDPAVAGMLQQMMGSPVPVVASLAQVPQPALGDLYVFANGFRPQATPAGPFGFQPDVFDSAPGHPGYTPLRRVVKVNWNDPGQARLLTSTADIGEAHWRGEITLEATQVVINAPLLTWPGGHR
ncbi:MAG: hypothetical protein M3O70_29315 [Actinomycetota bacterium]|nr:hypothetical protein [Actinomycetota bacterium]